MHKSLDTSALAVLFLYVEENSRLPKVTSFGHFEFRSITDCDKESSIGCPQMHTIMANCKKKENKAVFISFLFDK